MYNDYQVGNLEKDEIIVYLRKSRADDPSLSVEEVLLKHETILDEWSERNLGTLIPDENKFREVVSGETIADRPQIQRILKLIESPKIKAILTVEVQRLSRGDLEDAGKLIKLLRYTSTLVITPQKTYDLRDEYDRDIFERELKRGNEFLEYQKKIMNRGRYLSVSQGNYIYSVKPYGYDKIWVMEGKRKCPTLAINEEEANVVRMIFDTYLHENKGYVGICAKLEKLGIPSPSGAPTWSPAGLKDLLTNPLYIGKVRWYWRKVVKVARDGEVVATTPRNKEGDYPIFDGKHEAIISEDIFNAVREKMGHNPRVKADRPLVNPLAGLIFCSCGRAMILRKYPSRPIAARMICTNQKHCNVGSCTQDELISFVRRTLAEQLHDFKVELRNQNKNAEKARVNAVKTLEKKLKSIEARELLQWEAQSDPDPSKRMPASIFKQLNDKLQKEKLETENALKEAMQITPIKKLLEDKVMRFTDAVSALNNPSLSAPEVNALLRNCIERITYHRDRPIRLQRQQGEKKGTRFKSTGSFWSEPPISIDIKLKA